MLCCYASFSQIELPKGYTHVKPVSDNYHDYFWSNGRIDFTSDVISQGQETAAEIANDLRSGDSDGELIMETKDGLFVKTGRRSDSKFHYVVFVPKRDVFFVCSSYNNDSEFQNMSKWLLNQVRAHLKRGTLETYFADWRGRTD